MVRWTDAQQEAISLRKKNILVSAAAGSGKTAVLVERIKQLIIEEQIGLDQFLIVTFTNAAAAEMKEKLIRAITKAIEEDPENSAFLRRQLDLAGSANISTFHSFALEVIRRYFYLTDMEPDFKIGDEGTVEIIKWDVMDQLFSDHFEEGDEAFFHFLKSYASDRNERSLKESLLHLYATIQSIPHPEQWLKRSVESLNMNEDDFQSSALAEFVREDMKLSVAQILEGFRIAGEIAETAGIEGIYNKNLEDLQQLEPLERLAKQGKLEEMGNLLSSFKANTMRAGKEEKEAYEEIKEDIKNARDYSKKQLAALKERYFAQSMETYLEDMKKIYPSACYLEKLLNEFHQRFRTAKQEKKLMDFNDIEHYALDILEHQEAAEEYRNKFACIFVDEYQDSNVLQDTLIGLICRKDNLFLVGDIKQSIYKFRLAEPEIFQQRYEAYASGREECSTKIDLNRNFRSKRAVVETVNGIFSQIMKGYDDAAALHQGVADTGIDYETRLHVIDSRIPEGAELDEEIAEMKNAELEACVAAELIKEIVGKPIFDVKQQCERKLSRKDIVILMRGTKNYADVFQEVFTQRDIPSYIDDSGGYFDTVEIQVFLDLLKVIDNKQQDIPLLSVLYSAIFDFSVDDLIMVRLEHRDTSYYEALKACAQNCRDQQLQKKCQDVFQKLTEYRQMAQALPLEEFIWKLMWETGYYTYCGALPSGQQRQANLRALSDKAREFKETGYGGIYGFLTYIQALEKRRIPTGQVKLANENEDIVRIMTIHKSKGLEFPIVIVAGLGKRFNLNKTGKGFLAHKDLGLGLTRVSYEDHWYRKTLMQTAIERKMRQEDLEEEIRILYVALTRAMDQLILLGTSKNIEDGQIQTSPAKSCFLDYLVPFLEEGKIELRIHDRSQLSLQNSMRGQNRQRVEQLLSEPVRHEKGELFKEIERKLSFSYPKQQALSKKSKYSVTELSHMGTGYQPEHVLKIPAFMQGSTEFTAARRGTIMHKVMECISFKEALGAVEKGQGVEYVKSQVQSMIQQELLLEEEAFAVEPDKIVSFFQTDMGARAAQSERLYKETEFNLMKEIDGVQVMVQGIIDCYFEEKDHLILIDYKNSYVDHNNREASVKRLKETYEGQIKIYKEALEVIRQKPVEKAGLYLFSENEFIFF